MSQRKKKQQLSRRQRQRSPNSALLGHMRPPADTKIIPTPAGMEMMSEVMIEFIEPYEWTDLQDLTKLVGIAAFAWNLALTPADKRQEALQKMARVVPADIRPVIMQHVEELMERKRLLFPDNKRFILNYEVTMREDGPFVSIMSSLPEGAEPPPELLQTPPTPGSP